MMNNWVFSVNGLSPIGDCEFPFGNGFPRLGTANFHSGMAFPCWGLRISIREWLSPVGDCEFPFGNAFPRLGTLNSRSGTPFPCRGLRFPNGLFRLHSFVLSTCACAFSVCEFTLPRGGRRRRPPDSGRPAGTRPTG